MSNVFRPSAKPTTATAKSSTSVARPTQIKTEKKLVAGKPLPAPVSYRLRPISAANRNNKRFHVAKFASRQPIDPMSFQQPMTMQRKDPRSLRYQQQQQQQQREKQQQDQQNQQQQERQQQSDRLPGEVKDEDSKDSVKKEGEDVKMELETEKPEPSKVAPADEGTVAPDVHGKQSKKNLFQKKTRQVFTGHEEERTLRYEEYYPWLLEDFEGKNTWVSNYEGAQSDCYVFFVHSDDGFTMIPAEKWYKFTPRNKYVTLSLDEAEDLMAKKSQPPRWLMRHLRPETPDEEAENGPIKKRLKTVDNGSRIVRKRDDDDADELDYDEEFADDEEAPIMEGPEDESREVELRMKRQMRTDESENIDDRLSDNRRIGSEGKKLKQSLLSLENNAIYESEDDEDDEDDEGGLNELF
ncbi:hypothetical protein V1514DRAFT_326485 [Lipomyces japonicus]|uniref:uncharacterized protein n=1 Tax=Lipomyces japonicus TaxID=56871 RepID=UPI0034D01B78